MPSVLLTVFAILAVAGAAAPAVDIGLRKQLLVDDLVATGGTAEATCKLIERLGARLVGCSFLIALSFLPGVERLRSRGIRALVTY